MPVARSTHRHNAVPHLVISTGVEKSLTIPIVARDYSFWVYIVTNVNHTAYRCTKLIYYEHYRDIRDTIARETQLKRWSRAKKIELINRLNPRWMDVGDQVSG